MNSLQLEVPAVPTSQLDPYSEEVLADPWATYRELQELGPAQWIVLSRWCEAGHDLPLRVPALTPRPVAPAAPQAARRPGSAVRGPTTSFIAGG